MRFGVFMAPLHHRVDDNPTLSMHQDLELLEFLDRIDVDEAWIGEHHSGAVEIFASPEVMIAAAAQRTQHIRLGSGVVDLPLHHPFMVADRMVMLDHLTRGRAMLGVGSGALRADFTMLGRGAADRLGRRRADRRGLWPVGQPGRLPGDAVRPRRAEPPGGPRRVPRALPEVPPAWACWASH
jgi:limonene 1,2-monooxygenase